MSEYRFDRIDWFVPKGEDFTDFIENIYKNMGKDVASNSGHPSPRVQLLRDAEQLVTRDRNKLHGEPEANHQRIANLWNAFLSNREYPDDPLSAHECALMMSLMKLARIQHNPDLEDSWTDAVGYLAVGYDAYQAGEDASA